MPGSPPTFSLHTGMKTPWVLSRLCLTYQQDPIRCWVTAPANQIGFSHWASFPQFLETVVSHSTFMFQGWSFKDASGQNMLSIEANNLFIYCLWHCTWQLRRYKTIWTTLQKTVAELPLETPVEDNGGERNLADLFQNWQAEPAEAGLVSGHSCLELTSLSSLNSCSGPNKTSEACAGVSFDRKKGAWARTYAINPSMSRETQRFVVPGEGSGWHYPLHSASFPRTCPPTSTADAACLCLQILCPLSSPPYLHLW